MPNYCNFSMKIVGEKSKRDIFVKRLVDYNQPNHFWRIFTADIYDEWDDGESGATLLCGDCAWSLETCCRASGYSNGVDLFAVNTEELGLKLEAYSREPGMQFEEHYIYDNGECIKDECVDVVVFWWDTYEYPTFEEFKKDYEEAPDESCFDDNGEAYIGGFGDNYENWCI